MVRKSRIILLTAMVLVCGSCRQTGSSSKAIQKRAFPPLSIPTVYVTPEERQSYAADHFWDGFFTLGYESDSTTFCGVADGDLESAMGLYATILGQVPLDCARKSVQNLVDRLESFRGTDSLATDRVVELVDRYLYDPNSPVRDEDVYQPFAERLSLSAMVPEARRGAYARDAICCQLNQRGTPAADFVFKEINGRTHTLYSIKAPLTILFFSNPGCSACRDIIESLMARMYLVDMIERGELAIVNVYIDEELDKWKEYQQAYPESWYNGYDPTYSIRTDLIYNVRAIPSLYVLDEKKNVIMKDAPQEKVLQMLDNLVNQ